MNLAGPQVGENWPERWTFEMDYTAWTVGAGLHAPITERIGMHAEAYYMDYDSEPLVQFDGSEVLRVRAVHEPDAEEIGLRLRLFIKGVGDNCEYFSIVTDPFSFFPPVEQAPPSHRKPTIRARIASAPCPPSTDWPEMINDRPKNHQRASLVQHPD